MLQDVLQISSVQGIIDTWWQPPFQPCSDTWMETSDRVVLLAGEDVNGMQCHGVCTYSARKFLNGTTPFLCFLVVGLPFKNVCDLDRTVTVAGTVYSLFAVTFYSPGHFIGAVQLCEPFRCGWWLYDGLSKCRMSFVGTPPVTPKDFRLSSMFYVANVYLSEQLCK